MFSKKELDKWVKNNINVLFEGYHGVGKSTIIMEAFKKHNIKYLYFSASTLDPWVDLIGVPKESKDGNLELLRPKYFEDGNSVEAIFFDELNRAPSKVKNAVMELIQFKSINGKKFENLKMVWAAINPEETNEDDLNYDVETLDPALRDRFQIQVEIPFKPDQKYFSNKYDKNIGNAVMEFWKSIPKKNKLLVSPRRLDYAVDLFQKGINLNNVFHKSIKYLDLVKKLEHGTIGKKIKSVYESRDEEEAKKMMSDDNVYFSSINLIMEDMKIFNWYVNFMNSDIISSILDSNINNNIFVNFIIQYNKNNKVKEVIDSIIEANINCKTVNKIKSFISNEKIIRILSDDNIEIEEYDDSQSGHIHFVKYIEYNVENIKTNDITSICESIYENMPVNYDNNILKKIAILLNVFLERKSIFIKNNLLIKFKNIAYNLFYIWQNEKGLPVYDLLSDKPYLYDFAESQSIVDTIFNRKQKKDEDFMF